EDRLEPAAQRGPEETGAGDPKEVDPTLPAAVEGRGDEDQAHRDADDDDFDHRAGPPRSAPERKASTSEPCSWTEGRPRRCSSSSSRIPVVSARFSTGSSNMLRMCVESESAWTSPWMMWANSWRMVCSR